MHDLLVIDDSATVRKLVELSMRGTSLRPHFAASGAEGVRRATSLAPAAILLDCVLPDMTGVAVCSALAADARTRSIPILVVTAKHERTRIDFQNFPAVVDFVAKPFTPPDLLARIDRALAGAVAPGAKPERDLAQRVARILYQRLRDGLTQVPAYLREREPGAVAATLARRLLTPEVMELVVGDLRGLDELRGPGEPVVATAPVAPLRLGLVVDRAPGFSARIAEVTLSAIDRKVLAVSDGRTSLARIAERLDLPARQVATTIVGLRDRGLLVETEVVAPAPTRPVLICEPDVAAFQVPLRSLLQHRSTMRELVTVARIADLVGAVQQHHPCLVLVYASDRLAEAQAVGRALRVDGAPRDLAIVAVLEPRATATSAELLAAGFDAVFTKPVLAGDLERFLVTTSLR